ncbi:hypothetical protein LXL04_033814 [Taraxacum kok-saghyz]
MALFKFSSIIATSENILRAHPCEFRFLRAARPLLSAPRRPRIDIRVCSVFVFWKCEEVKTSSLAISFSPLLHRDSTGTNLISPLHHHRRRSSVAIKPSSSALHQADFSRELLPQTVDFKQFLPISVASFSHKPSISSNFKPQQSRASATVPLTGSITRKPSAITMLQRIATGIFISSVSMVVAAVIATKRLNTAREYGLLDDPNARIPMKIWWLLPQYLLAELVMFSPWLLCRSYFMKEACKPVDDDEVEVPMRGSVADCDYMTRLQNEIADQLMKIWNKLLFLIMQSADVEKTNSLLAADCRRLDHLFFCRALQMWSADRRRFHSEKTNRTLTSTCEMTTKDLVIVRC